MGTMYLVRIDLKNGQQRVLTFQDLGKGKAAADTVAQARYLGHQHPPQPNAWHIQDDAGREVWGEGSDLALVQFIDLETEVNADVSARIMAMQIEYSLMQRAGLVQQPSPPPAAPERRAPRLDDPDVVEDFPVRAHGKIGGNFAS